MSDTPPRKSCVVPLASPNATLVAPSVERRTDSPGATRVSPPAPGALADKAAPAKKTYDDGTEKPPHKAALEGLSPSPLIPVPEPSVRSPAVSSSANRYAAAQGYAAAAADRGPRGRRSFFGGGSGGGASAQPEPMQGSAALRHAREMALLERRLETERSAGPTAAEAELRLMQLKYEALKATAARGPRTADGIFKASCATDLVFLLDVTGSMQMHIDAAKDQIKQMVQEINTTFFGEADVRVAVVAYRDHADEMQYERLRFTKDMDRVHSFLAGLQARGGNDACEDVLGGLNEALDLSWHNPTRCLMHIGDAPAHGNNMHTMGKQTDDYYDGAEPHGLRYEAIIDRMIAQSINYVFFRINNSTDRMLYLFLRHYASAAPDAQLCTENSYVINAEMEMIAIRRAKHRRPGAGVAAVGAGASAGAGDSFVDGAMNGGLHFEEVKLGVSYADLSRLVVSGVAASSSRTAVRLSTSMRSSSAGWSSGTRSKFNKKKGILGNVSEDAPLEVFAEEEDTEDAKETQDEPKNAKKAKKVSGLDTATSADTLVADTVPRAGTTPAAANAADSNDDGSDDDLRRRPARDVIELEEGPPQWTVPGWLDQTIKFKAFSPDVVDMQRLPGGGAGGSDSSSDGKADGSSSSSTPDRLLDRMIESDDNIPMSTTELTILRRSKPFAQGALRVASYARTEASTNPLVVKTFKKGDKKLADLAEDMRLQALCKAFALEFNNLVANEHYSLDFIVVTCLQPVHATILSGGEESSSGEKDECLTLEPLLSTDSSRYVKYNNNCGGVSRLGLETTRITGPHTDEKGKTKSKTITTGAGSSGGPEASRERRAQAAAQAAALNQAAQAFSHFTFERSRGAMLVVDLQGVGNVLTDPAVHTRDPTRFVLSDTNLNEDGFKLFFATHRCNGLCRHLRLSSKASMFRQGPFVFRGDWTLPVAKNAALTDRKKKAAVAGGAAGAAGSDGHAGDLVNGAYLASEYAGYGSAFRACPPPDMLVCCANKLCSKIVRVSTARTAPAGFYWCDRCWPQLTASSVMRVCATPGAYHEFEVSTFFFESQGQILPSTCTAHGGVVSQPVPKGKPKVSFFRRLACFRRDS